MGKVRYITLKPKNYETDIEEYQPNVGNKWKKRAKRLMDRRWSAINKREHRGRYALS